MCLKCLPIRHEGPLFATRRTHLQKRQICFPCRPRRWYHRRGCTRAGRADRSSSWRSIVALNFFAVAAEPGSDLAPVRGLRRLAQTTTGVEYLQRAKLTAGDGAAEDIFGNSVSIDGDTMVIGAVYDDDNGVNSGSAYVFTRNTAGNLTSGWTQVAKLTADAGGLAHDKFGHSVSIDGDTVVIGVREDDDPANSGSAYVFARVTAGDLTSGWTRIAKLTADDGASSAEFGVSVSIDGDTMVIGANLDDDPANSGSAYVFTRDTPGDPASGWTQVAKLTADDAAASAQFGMSVSIDGDTVAVGAHGTGAYTGSAYVFTRNTAGDLASNWKQVAKLTDAAAVDNYFGRSVSIDGDTWRSGRMLTPTTRDPTAGPCTYSRATPPATLPPAGRRLPSLPRATALRMTGSAGACRSTATRW